MTCTYKTPGTQNTLPNYENFCRYASNKLTNSDFSTLAPSNSIEKTAQALKWSEQIGKRKIYLLHGKNF